MPAGSFRRVSSTSSRSSTSSSTSRSPSARRFIGQLAQRLSPQGRLFVSTPYPAFTRDRRLKGDDTLQIIDEEVELADVVAEAASAGLRLIAYRAYDVFAGSPEYQVMVFMPRAAARARPADRAR